MKSSCYFVIINILGTINSNGGCFMSVYLKIKENYDSMTAAEKKIADFIINNPKGIVGVSVQDIGKNTETSPATVVRFSKNLGYGSLAELKIAIATESDPTEDKSELYETISSSDDTETLINKMGNRTIDNIKTTMELIDCAELEKAIKAIRAAENIYVFGVGASALVALDFQNKMVRVNKRVIFNLDSNLQLASSVYMTERDVAIAISYSGKTKEVNLAIEQANINGATTIAITKCGKSNLSSIVDIVLNIPSTEKELRLGAISSRVSQFLVSDMLFLGIVQNQLDVTEEKLIQTRDIIANLKEK